MMSFHWSNTVSLNTPVGMPVKVTLPSGIALLDREVLGVGRARSTRSTA